MHIKRFFGRSQKNYNILFPRTMSVDGKLEYPDGSFVFYKQRTVKEALKPGIIFCSGYNSSLNGNKPTFLDNYCEKRNISYLRFDYIGHENSSGTIHDALLSTWKQNFLDVIDKLTSGPQLIVGSSIGGWIGLLGAIERPQRIHSIVTIANAADFANTRFTSATPEQQEKAKQLGYFTVPGSDSVIPFPFFEDCKDHLLLDPSGPPIPIECPVRMIHGMADDLVPYQVSLKVAEKIASDDVMVQLVKNGDHRMSSEKHLNLLEKILDETLNISLQQKF